MEIKKAIKLRNSSKKKKPGFMRQEGKKMKKLLCVWRRPKGRTSKLRMKEKARGKHPSPGYGSTKMVRGLTRVGLEKVMISNPNQVTLVDPKSQAIMISATVGKRKREMIMTAAKEAKISVING